MNTQMQDDLIDALKSVIECHGKDLVPVLRISIDNLIKQAEEKNNTMNGILEKMKQEAAPEMYEALKEYIDYIERKLAQRTNTFYQHMKKAINKADGK